MGHYCGECDERLVGGIESTCCKEADSYCLECWNLLAKLSVPDNILQSIVSDIRETKKLSLETEEKINSWGVQKNLCPYCESELSADSCIDNYYKDTYGNYL